MLRQYQPLTRRSNEHGDVAHRPYWILATLLFVVGDLVTTVYFIEIGIAVEANPVGAFIMAHGYGWVVAWKLGVLAVFYGLYRASPSAVRVGVPVGLALLGGFITCWNTFISVTGTYPF